MTMMKAAEWYARQPRIAKWALAGVGLAAAAAGGVVLAPCAGALVSAFGFGMAGGTLSGAAASSAGLAALGGGAVATGGLGMAGGTVVVAGASSAVGGAAAGLGSRFVTKKGAESAERVARAEKRDLGPDDFDGEI